MSMRRAILIELAKRGPLGLHGLALGTNHAYGLMPYEDALRFRRALAWSLGWLTRERMVERSVNFIDGGVPLFDVTDRGRKWLEDGKQQPPSMVDRAWRLRARYIVCVPGSQVDLVRSYIAGVDPSDVPVVDLEALRVDAVREFYQWLRGRDTFTLPASETLERLLAKWRRGEP
jgi:hypothetical protein